MEEQSTTVKQALEALRSICQLEPAAPAAARNLEKSPEPDGIPAHDPEEWRAPFVEWLDFACACHPRAFGGLVSLHIAFCESQAALGTVGCTRETFIELLNEAGFSLTGEVNGVTLVASLTFRDDVEWCLDETRGA